MKQTAVEWFANRISHGGLVSKKQFDELLEQAKEMFEKQIIEAYRTGVWDLGCRSADSEEYYNRNFKQQEQ
jgi:hypothetical protein